MAQAGFTPIQLYRTTTASAQPSAGNLAAGELAINLTDKKLYAKDASNNVFLLADASSGGTTAANLAGGAAGSLPYQSGANATTFLGIGAANRVLTSSGTAPQWVTSLTGLTGVSSSSMTNTSLTSGRLVYSTTGGAQTDSANLTYNGSTLVNNGAADGTNAFSVSGNTVGGFLALRPDGTNGQAIRVGGSGAEANTLRFLGSSDTEYMRLTSTGLSLAATSDLTLNKGTANGVLYLNGSKVATSGTALAFNGTSLTVGAGSGNPFARINGGTSAGQGGGYAIDRNGTEIGGVYSGSWYTSGSAAVNTLAVGTTTAEALLFGINYFEQMRLDSTGLGIGTSSPATKLHVDTGAAGYGLTLAASSLTSRRFQFGLDSVANLAVYDTAAAAVRMTLDVSGNLGIGTTSPSEKLEVNGNIRLSGRGATFALMTPDWRMYNSSSGNALVWDNYSSEQMRLDASGNLGIGTNSPSRKLDVQGAPLSVGGNGTGVLANFVNNTTAFNASPTAAISLWNRINSSGSTFPSAVVQAGKENTTDGNYAGYLSLQTTDAGGTSNERMRLDSSGNLGLGVTPSAWESTCKMFQFGSLGTVGRANSGQTQLGFNYFINSSGQYIYLTTTQASRYEQIASEHRWFTAPSGTAGNTISFTQAMTLDASGNLGVGVTNPAAKLEVYGGASGTVTNIQVGNAATGFVFGIDSSNNCQIRTAQSVAILFYTASIQRASIPAAGGMVVGTAALATSATDGFLYVPTCAGTPTGTPTTQTGTAPIVVDTTNNKLYFYSGGQWRDAGP